MTATAAGCPDGSPLNGIISPPGSCDWWSASCPLCGADFDRYDSEAAVLGRLTAHLEDCSIGSRDHDGVLPAARARLAQLEGTKPRAGSDPDRMAMLGALPGLDFSTGTTTRVGRPAYRDHDTLILPAVQLDLAGIAAARGLLDQAERDILACRFRLFAADGDWTGWDIDIRRCAQWLDVLGISFEGDDTDPVISADWPRAAGCLRHAAELGGGGFEELRALVDLLCSDKTPADAAEDLPDACGWHGGEGDGGEFCEGCRDDQAAKLAAGTENGQ